MSATWTEKTVLDAIEPRYRKPGNGGSGEYAFLRQVRNAAGFDATRTFDAVAVHLWPSRGFVTDVIEVKVSRSDWLRELKDPAKAEAAFVIGDRFIVAAPSGIIQVGELPPGWGLLEVTEKRTRMSVAPECRSKGRTTFPAGFVVAMLRAAGAAATTTPDDREVERRLSVELAKAHEREDQRVREVQAREREKAVLATTFLNSTRLRLYSEEEAVEQGARVRAALAADSNRSELVKVLGFQRDRLDRMIADLKVGGAADEPPHPRGGGR